MLWGIPRASIWLDDSLMSGFQFLLAGCTPSGYDTLRTDPSGQSNDDLYNGLAF